MKLSTGRDVVRAYSASGLLPLNADIEETKNDSGTSSYSVVVYAMNGTGAGRWVSSDPVEIGVSEKFSSVDRLLATLMVETTDLVTDAVHAAEYWEDRCLNAENPFRTKE